MPKPAARPVYVRVAPGILMRQANPRRTNMASCTLTVERRMVPVGRNHLSGVERGVVVTPRGYVHDADTGTLLGNVSGSWVRCGGQLMPALYHNGVQYVID
jgi:hypothetical protein